MKIYIFSLLENLNFCKQLAPHLNSLGHETTVFESISKFMLQIQEHTDQPDLYILDYFLYNHYVFNPYSYLKENNCNVPLISFNDPQRKTDSDTYYWKSILELLYGDNFSWENYKNVIEQVTTLVKKLNNLELNTIIESAERKSEVKVPGNLSSSEIILFKMMKEKINQSISIEEMRLAIQKTEKICRVSTIACIVSSIRKKLTETGISDIQIIKNGAGYKMISF